MDFAVRSSSEQMLSDATRTAHQFADRFRRDDVVGIVFLGAIVRGYFDAAADIDVALIAKGSLGNDCPPQYHREDGFEIHCWVSEYTTEVSEPWSMGKRWAHSESLVHYDPEGLIAPLVAERTKLTDEERRWLMVSGTTLSEWYIRRLSALWVDRGSLLSAHSMLSQGVSHFCEALFALNHKLVADHKWRTFYAERLPVTPAHFSERMAELIVAKELTVSDLERRVSVFMQMWEEIVRLVEKEVGSTFAEFKDTV